jgi:hypothetical protein
MTIALPRHRAWSHPVAPAQSPHELHDWEVVTAGVPGWDVFRLSAVPATLRASPRTELRCAPHRERAFDCLSYIWLPAILHHP